jgi:uridine kinase
MLDQLCTYILNKKVNHPTRVAIDGTAMAGKTILTKELVFPLRRSKRQVISVNLDHFHNPAQVRYRRGKDSPEGYYYDSFNYASLIENILDPLSPGGNLKIRRLTFDPTSNSEVDNGFETVQENAVVLFDGIFLMRPELERYWDIMIFVDITTETAMSRAYDRELRNGLSYTEISQLYEKRYFAGQRIYFERCHPLERADIVIENNDFRSPFVKFQKPNA